MKRLALILCLFVFGLDGAVAQEASLPEKFKEADKNTDGAISVTEVVTMIDGYFIGLHDHGVMYIHDLIDYFFEQRTV